LRSVCACFRLLLEFWIFGILEGMEDVVSGCEDCHVGVSHAQFYGKRWACFTVVCIFDFAVLYWEVAPASDLPCPFSSGETTIAALI